MGRGFIAGSIWGALVGFVAIALAAQLTERRELSFPEPETTALEVPGGTAFDPVRPETDPVVPSPEEQTSAETSPAGVAVPGAEAGSVPVADTASAGVPAAVSGALPQPADPAMPGASGVAVTDADPAGPSQAAPAAPPAAEPPVSGPDATTGAAALAPAPSSGDSPSVAGAGQDPATGPSATAAALPAQGADALPAGAADTPGAPAAGLVTPSAPTRIAAPGSEETALAGTGLPQVGLSTTPDVTTDRLPRIGDGAPTDAAAQVNPDADNPDAPAIRRYAVPFDNAARSPVIAIVLMHEGTALPDTRSGLDLPVPVSFAVRSGSDNAGAIAAAYRAAGREVVMIPSLPPGATPADVEVALQANFAAVPEAVAIMDDPETGFQSERTAVSQVVDVLATTGHGLVTFPRGLNTAQQLAERAGLPARPVFRVLDDADNSTGDIRRTIDRAAFRARQEGVVLLVGRTRPETVAAIVEWSLANTLGNVALSPVSAALLAK